MPLTLVTSEQEALKTGFRTMEGGGDGIDCAWALSYVEALAKAGVPVPGHAGRAPRAQGFSGASVKRRMRPSLPMWLCVCGRHTARFNIGTLHRDKVSGSIDCMTLVMCRPTP